MPVLQIGSGAFYYKRYEYTKLYLSLSLPQLLLNHITSSVTQLTIVTPATTNMK